MMAYQCWGEAFLAISVLGEQARGEQPHNHTA